MSWSVTAEVTPWDGWNDLSGSGLNVPEHKEQYEAAKVAVERLLATNAVGGADKTYNVTISGHGNPDHVPTAGWANDFVSIVIHQQS